MVVPLCARKVLLSRSTFLKIPKRNGYFVLVPEVGDDSVEKYPLLGPDKLPDFKQITAERCVGAIARQTVEFEESVKALGKKVKENENMNIFKDVLLPLEESYAPLEVTWGIAQLLYLGNLSRLPSKYYENIHERANIAKATKYVDMSIFTACKKTLENKKVELTDEQRRLLQKFIMEGRLNALELTEKQKSRLGYYHSVLLQKQAEYFQKLQIQSKKFAYTISDPNVIKGCSATFLQKVAVNPVDYTRGPWKLTLDSFVVKHFLEYCPQRQLRWILWEADVMKASLYDDALYQVSSALEEIREKRQLKAKLLGYQTYADLSMETKMADNLEKVTNTLEELRKIARPAQDEELEELNKFANENGLSDTIKMWDIDYWSREYRETKYNYNPSVIKEYFPLPTVLSGLFNFIEAMFSVKFVERPITETWHKDVRFFDAYDLKESTNEPIGSFYYDPYSRPVDKNRLTDNIGWMIAIRRKSKYCGIKPLAALIFSFPAPINGQPSLLSFREVEALFQKFGHLLQYMLSKAECSETFGSSFMEWDAVNIPDYFLSNWLYEPSVLQKISGHWKTNDPLPIESIQSIRSIKTCHSGYYLCKKLYYSQLDLELHSSTDFWNNIVKRMWDKYFAIPLYKKDAHVCSFQSIFSGNAGAAYYSSLWSEIIAADLFSAYLEHPNKELQHQLDTGDKYRETFLRLGGIYPTNELFRRFRGRDPSEKALLKSLGLEARTSDTSASNN